MATRIPPHNLTEVAGAVNLHVNTIIAEGVESNTVPDISIEEYMEHVKGPDFPTGGLVVDTPTIKEAILKGRGSIKIRAVADVEELGLSLIHI